MAKTTNKNELLDCFVIMPVSESDGYREGHFGHVFDNIIAPSCNAASYNPIRADQVKETNLIHLDILTRLIEAPMAICDLSTRNPNVLFELGIRQAFDKPVVLIQEKDTPPIFDISPLRYLEYCKELRYHDVLRTQEALKKSIIATAAAKGDAGNVNSIVKLLALNSPAVLPDVEQNKDSLTLDYMRSEMRELRRVVERVERAVSNDVRTSDSPPVTELELLKSEFNSLISSPISSKRKVGVLLRLQGRAEEMMVSTDDVKEHIQYARLVDRIRQAIIDSK